MKAHALKNNLQAFLSLSLFTKYFKCTVRFGKVCSIWQKVLMSMFKIQKAEHSSRSLIPVLRYVTPDKPLPTEYVLPLLFLVGIR